jgi:hypothetical protein
MAETDTAWVIAAGTGAVVTGYQSWCKVEEECNVGFPRDVCKWTCANTGLATPTTEHRIRSLAATFQRR